MRFGNQPHRRGACTGALKLTALARQWYADADVDAATAIVAPTNITTRQRLMIALLFYE
jgi:hypothetical protein